MGNCANEIQPLKGSQGVEDVDEVMFDLGACGRGLGLDDVCEPFF